MSLIDLVINGAKMAFALIKEDQEICFELKSQLTHVLWCHTYSDFLVSLLETER